MSSNGVTLTKRRNMTIYKYTQVRKYTHIPNDFLLQLKSWFEQQHFKIKKNTRGPGHLAGRRDGIHINFVPKFLLSVKNHPNHAEVTFSYAARIRKIGIATAILTEGLSVVIGAVTLSSHVAQARGFVDTVTDVMDSISGKPFEIRWEEATEAPGAETSSTTTTTQQVVAPPPIPPRPVSPPRTRAITPPLIMEKPIEPQVVYVPQPQVIYIPEPEPNLIHVDLGEAVMPTPLERPRALSSTRYPLPASYSSAPVHNYQDPYATSSGNPAPSDLSWAGYNNAPAASYNHNAPATASYNNQAQAPYSNAYDHNSMPYYGSQPQQTQPFGNNHNYGQQQQPSFSNPSQPSASARPTGIARTPSLIDMDFNQYGQAPALQPNSTPFVS